MRRLTLLFPSLVLLISVELNAAPGDGIGTEFQVNTYTIGPQFNYDGGAVALNANGGFVVVWDSSFLFDQDGSGAGVFGQRFTSSGAPIGVEFQINTYTTSSQYRSSVASDAAGNFMVAWESFEQDGNLEGVFGQMFSSSGTKVGSEFPINTYTMDDESEPEVACDADGDCVVVWAEFYNRIVARRFNTSGTSVGSEFQVNSFTDDSQTVPEVEADPAGNFIIVWSGYHLNSDNLEIMGQRFSSSGTPTGTEFQINTYSTYGQGRPRLAIEPDGDFVVVWQAKDGPVFSAYEGVFGQRFVSSGALSGTEFQVNTITYGFQEGQDVAIDANGDFTVVWGSKAGGFNVFGQRFDSAGTRLGSEYQINTYTTNDQFPLDVESNSNGALVVVWNSTNQDGWSEGVFGQRIEGNPTPSATNTATATVTATTTPTSGPSAVCPATPAPGCTTSTAGKLIVKDNADNTKDKLVWKFGKGPQIIQADFGNPVTTNGYAFCVYDDDALKIDLTIPGGVPWALLSTKGYQYKDSAGANDGVTKVKLLGGAVGRSKVQLKGKGAALSVPLPASATQLFEGSTAVVVQLHGNGDCWETSFTSIQSRHRVNSYRGKL